MKDLPPTNVMAFRVNAAPISSKKKKKRAHHSTHSAEPKLNISAGAKTAR